MAKVAKNLTLDRDVARRAEEYAAARGMSLSQFVGDLLSRITDSADPGAEFSPTVRRLLGAARTSTPKGDLVADYHGFLQDKYLRQ